MEDTKSDKIIVVGGAGCMGTIHVANLQSLGAEVASFDLTENKNCKNFMNQKHEDAVADGYTAAIVALPETIANK
jgi:myo-inositol 2-dehydrogenase / D-chiro-inositol 1-dehydrogenase